MQPASTIALRVVLTATLSLVLAWQLQALAKSMGFSTALLGNAFARDAGQSESLPPDILDAVMLVRNHRQAVSTGLRLAPAIAGDSLLMQRASEALYPVRISEATAVYLARNTDDSPTTCQLVDQSNRVGLFECAHRE